MRFSAILNDDEDEEDCVEMQVGTFDEEKGVVICSTPSWPLDEAVQVELSMNGVDFTCNENKFTFYKPPSMRSIWPTLGTSSGGTLLKSPAEALWT